MATKIGLDHMITSKSTPPLIATHAHRPDLLVVLGQGPSSPDNVIGDGAKREDAKENANGGDGGNDETLFEGVRRIMGPWGGVAVAGVAVYLTVVYVFWDVFRSYFAWSEALAITIVVRCERVPCSLSPLTPLHYVLCKVYGVSTEKPFL